MLENSDIDKLKQILSNNNQIKGIVFDDLGLIEVLKDINIEKILLLNHLATNYESINYYLDYVDSVVVSIDITELEIKEILKNAKKKLVLNVFGLNNLMYSKRKLLSNYQKHYNLDNNNEIDAHINDYYFHIFENEWGTTFYSKKYYNATKLIGLENVLYYWYNPVFLDCEKIKNVVLNNDLSGIDYDDGFLNKKTIYKLEVGDKS